MAQNRAKFGYLSYDDMLQRIAKGELDQHDVIFTKDTKETFIITPDLTPMPIKSRVYVFNSISEAEIAINENTDTYEGQIVSILDGDKYAGYVVNKNTTRRSNQYTVVPLADTSDINYDTLGNKPIINLIGTFESPITISQLSSGTYSVKGQYKIDDSEETVYLNASNIIITVEQINGVVNIKKITSSEIIDYKVVDGIVSKSVYATEKYLEEHGYVTSVYVDNKIAALDFITRDEISDYVDKLVNNILDETLNAKIDARIDEQIKGISNEEINNLFS